MARQRPRASARRAPACLPVPTRPADRQPNGETRRRRRTEESRRARCRAGLFRVGKSRSPRNLARAHRRGDEEIGRQPNCRRCSPGSYPLCSPTPFAQALCGYDRLVGLDSGARSHAEPEERSSATRGEEMGMARRGTRGWAIPPRRWSIPVDGRVLIEGLRSSVRGCDTRVRLAGILRFPSVDHGSDR